MAIYKVGTFTTTATGTAQNLALGFTPSYFKAWNDTAIATPTNTEVAMFEWFSSMANASAYVYTYNATPIQVLTKITSNGVTPYQTGSSSEYASTNKTITAITKAANAQITSASHGLSVGDVVTFSGVVGMIQINTLRGVVQTVPTANTFTVDIDTTGFTTYSSGGIANLISGTVLNEGTIGLTLGSSLVGTAADVWEYVAVLDAPFTS